MPALILTDLEASGASLRVLNMGLDTASPTGKLVLNVLGSIAQFERELMLERQGEGIAKAKAAGKYRGRKPTAKAKTPEIKRLMADGIGPTAIAKQLNISRASVYRLLVPKRPNQIERQGSSSEGLGDFWKARIRADQRDHLEAHRRLHDERSRLT